jgi:hypothetical protein
MSPLSLSAAAHTALAVAGGLIEWHRKRWTPCHRHKESDDISTVVLMTQ